MPSLYIIHIGDTKNAAQLFRRDFHRARAFSFAGRRLRESSRKRRVEGHVAFDFLHRLVNVAVQHRNGTELLQVGKGLRAVFSPPTPLRIDRPEWDVGKDDNGCTGFQVLYVIFEPFELL